MVVSRRARHNILLQWTIRPLSKSALWFLTQFTGQCSSECRTSSVSSITETIFWLQVRNHQLSSPSPSSERYCPFSSHGGWHGSCACIRSLREVVVGSIASTVHLASSFSSPSRSESSLISTYFIRTKL